MLFLSLVKAVNRATENPQDLEIRDACIQRFEYTYELANKLLFYLINSITNKIIKILKILFKLLLKFDIITQTA